jgi:hypothetical protein
VPRAVQRVATFEPSATVDDEHRARERRPVPLDELPHACWAANRLGLGRVVPDVVGGDELVDDVEVTRPRLLEDPPDDELGVLRRRSFQSSAPACDGSRHERSRDHSSDRERDRRTYDVATPPIEHRSRL